LSETRTTPAEVIELCRRQEIKMVDYRFADLVGTWQHFSSPVKELEESIFVDGIGFDGSSIRGFQRIDESDMLLVPDANTARIDPLLRIPTLLLICDVVDPVTRERYTRDPRFVAQKAEAYLVKTGIATTSYWGPEAEFFVFDDVRYDQSPHAAFYSVDAARASGIAAAMRNPTSATNRATKKATSPYRRPTACRTSAPASC